MQDQDQLVRYGQLMLMWGRDYISRIKPVKTGTCSISFTGARSIFGAWTHRNRRAGMKIAFNNPVWELYSIPLSCHKNSDRRSTLHREQLWSPNHSAPSGREGRRSVWEKERGGGMGGWRYRRARCGNKNELKLCLLFEKPFSNGSPKKLISFTTNNIEHFSFILKFSIIYMFTS